MSCGGWERRHLDWLSGWGNPRGMRVVSTTLFTHLHKEALREMCSILGYHLVTDKSSRRVTPGSSLENTEWPQRRS